MKYRNLKTIVTFLGIVVTIVNCGSDTTNQKLWLKPWVLWFCFIKSKRRILRSKMLSVASLLWAIAQICIHRLLTPLESSITGRNTIRVLMKEPLRLSW